jgi:hypothetical protein
MAVQRAASEGLVSPSSISVRRWTTGRSRTRRRWSGVLAALALALAGCGSPRPVPQPSELPFHTSDPLGFTLHWRLDRTADATVAEGVLEAARLDRYSQVTVELAGLDAGGSVVSRGRTTAIPRDFTGTTPWPFTARLRPTGGETRFTVRVADVLPKVTPGR